LYKKLKNKEEGGTAKKKNNKIFLLLLVPIVIVLIFDGFSSRRRGKKGLSFLSYFLTNLYFFKEKRGSEFTLGQRDKERQKRHGPGEEEA
jgi:flagellar basal body-associated protein FliL